MRELYCLPDQVSGTVATVRYISIWVSWLLHHKHYKGREGHPLPFISGFKFDWRFETPYHTRTRVHISYTHTLTLLTSDVAARQAETSLCEKPQPARHTETQTNAPVKRRESISRGSHHIAVWQHTIGQEITPRLHTPSSCVLSEQTLDWEL